MKRDLNLVRKILEAVEDTDIADLSGYSFNIVQSHCDMLEEAGLTPNLYLKYDLDGKNFSIYTTKDRLTMKGYDYLDKLRESHG